MHKLIKEAWNQEWNYAEEFYCTLDPTMTVTSANSSFKEWFEIMVGDPLVGLCLTPKARMNPIVGVEGEDTLIMRRPAVRVEGEVIYRAKKVKDEFGEFLGFVVKVEYLEPGITEIDPAMAQMRLNGTLTFDEKIVPLFG